MAANPKRVTTKWQFEQMVRVLEERHDAGIDASAFFNDDDTWTKITEVCNQHEPQRDQSGWRKVFCDWKYLTKRKLDDKDGKKPLTSQEMRLDKLLGLSKPSTKQKRGHSPVKEAKIITSAKKKLKVEATSPAQKYKEEHEEELEPDEVYEIEEYYEEPEQAVEEIIEEQPKETIKVRYQYASPYILNHRLPPVTSTPVQVPTQASTASTSTTTIAAPATDPYMERLLALIEERNQIEKAKLTIRKNKYMLMKKMYLSAGEEEPFDFK